MNLPMLAARNALRNRFRTILTVVGVAVAILAFVSLRTVLDAWDLAIESSAKDRLASRNKTSWVVPVPKKYLDKVRVELADEGLTAASYGTWFGAKDPTHKDLFFATIGAEAKSLFDVYDEMIVPEADKQAFIGDRTGALIGDALARQTGWKVGQRVTLQGTIYPGLWSYTIRGIYGAKRRSLDRGIFFFHDEYLQEKLPDHRRGNIGWLILRVADAKKGSEISRRVDELFTGSDIETFTQSEKAMNLSFMATFSAVLKAIDVVSLVILAIMTLILGNTIAMGVRERTNEYGVLRAIGFRPRHLVGFVAGESLTIGFLGGGLGLALSYPIVTLGMGRWLEENMSGFFPIFHVTPKTYATAMLLALGLAAVAAAWPAVGAARLRITDALRRVD